MRNRVIPSAYDTGRTVPRITSRSNPDRTPMTSERCFCTNEFTALPAFGGWFLQTHPTVGSNAVPLSCGAHRRLHARPHQTQGVRAGRPPRARGLQAHPQLPQGGAVRLDRATPARRRVDASNIVEGCARHSETDYLYFLDIAYASSREVEYQLSLAVRLGYLEPGAHRELAALCVETSKVLAGLIRALRR